MNNDFTMVNIKDKYILRSLEIKLNNEIIELSHELQQYNEKI